MLKLQLNHLMPGMHADASLPRGWEIPDRTIRSGLPAAFKASVCRGGYGRSRSPASRQGIRKLGILGRYKREEGPRSGS